MAAEIRGILIAVFHSMYRVFDGNVDQQQVVSNDIITAFESFALVRPAEDGSTSVENVLGILLSESNVSVKHPPESFKRMVQSTGLSPDDVAESMAIEARDGTRLETRPHTNACTFHTIRPERLPGFGFAPISEAIICGTPLSNSSRYVGLIGMPDALIADDSEFMRNLLRDDSRRRPRDRGDVRTESSCRSVQRECRASS